MRFCNGMNKRNAENPKRVYMVEVRKEKMISWNPVDELNVKIKLN